MLVTVWAFQDVNTLPRFMEEFGSPDQDDVPEATDFKQTFHGNIDGTASGVAGLVPSSRCTAWRGVTVSY